MKAYIRSKWYEVEHMPKSQCVKRECNGMGVLKRNYNGPGITLPCPCLGKVIDVETGLEISKKEKKSAKQ
jgi:hypothetical protein